MEVQTNKNEIRVFLLPVGVSVIRGKGGKEPAEISTLRHFAKHFGELSRNDTCILFATDTPDGKKAAEKIKSLIKEEFSVNVKGPKIVENLKISNTPMSDFQAALNDFAGIISSQINEIKEKGEDYQFYAIGTTGYKPLSNILTLIAMLHGFPILYYFEDSNQIFQLPSLDLKLSSRVLAQDYIMFDTLKCNKLSISEFKRSFNLKEIPAYLRPFIQNTSGYTVLTSLGELLYTHFQDEYLDDRLKVSWKRKFVEDVFLPNIKPKSVIYVILLDIDDFKRINDEHGYSFGDKVIKFVAEKLVNSCKEFRRWDHAFPPEVIRWGGEEFLIIGQVSHQKNHDDIPCKLATKLRIVIEKSSCRGDTPMGLKVTLSGGVAKNHLQSDLNAEYRSMEFFEKNLLKVANEYLHEAKSSGKNIVVPCELK